MDFQDLCKEKKIITLCMLAHSSHLLQPLNVACFSPLKRLYSNKISALARSRIYYINKETFLLAFKATFKKIFIAENVCAGFRGARLVLHNCWSRTWTKSNNVLVRLGLRDECWFWNSRVSYPDGVWYDSSRVDEGWATCYTACLSSRGWDSKK